MSRTCGTHHRDIHRRGAEHELQERTSRLLNNYVLQRGTRRGKFSTHGCQTDLNLVELIVTGRRWRSGHDTCGFFLTTFQRWGRRCRCRCAIGCECGRLVKCKNTSLGKSTVSEYVYMGGVIIGWLVAIMIGANHGDEGAGW